jgi:hypothetical protein
MTEVEWLASNDPEALLSYHLRGAASDRKLRLFAVACCRRIWHLLVDPRSQAAVEVAEQFADNIATAAQLERAYESAEVAHHEAFTAKGKERASLEWAAQYAADRVPFFAARRASRFARVAAAIALNSNTENEAQANLLREIFVNEFRPVTIDPIWRTWNDGTVTKLASTIYADRAFDRLPILADALEDAGCDNTDLLAHCRGQGPHVRGCWAVDFLLGKG